MNQCRLLVAKIHLQPQPVRMLDNGADRRVDNLVVQRDLDVVAASELREVVKRLYSADE